MISEFPPSNGRPCAAYNRRNSVQNGINAFLEATAKCRNGAQKRRKGARDVPEKHPERSNGPITRASHFAMLGEPAKAGIRLLDGRPPGS